MTVLALPLETGSGSQRQAGWTAIPLVVDLDGTVVRTDTLIEALLRLAATRPLLLLTLLPTLMLRGRAAFKQCVAEAVRLDPATLVYNEDVMGLAQDARAAGRPVYLATASDRDVADAVAGHLGLFDGVFASENNVNLKGEAKAALLAATFGEAGFDYAGDAEVDRPVWRRARRAIMVLPSAKLARQVEAECPDAVVLGRRPGVLAQLRVIAKAMRVHQWAKNILIFVPALAAHQAALPTGLQAAVAFAAFSLCASSVYLLNDLVDLPHDRLHPSKRRRPFASGALPLPWAPGLIALTLGGGLCLAALLPPSFFLMLMIYYACTVSYSFALKRKMVADVLMLAALYTIRVFAGAAATSIAVSPWLLAFSMFLFFSLAVVKRQSELTLLGRAGRGEVSGRGYLLQDLSMLHSMAASSGYMAVLVLALYISSTDVLPLYHTPQALWLLCPVLLFWISRVMMLSQRGHLHDDPVVFALTDRVSLFTGAVGFCIVIAASV